MQFAFSGHVEDWAADALKGGANSIDSIAVTLCAFKFLPELLCEPDKLELSSSKAEYLHLDLEAAEMEAKVDAEGAAMIGPGVGLVMGNLQVWCISEEIIL